MDEVIQNPKNISNKLMGELNNLNIYVPVQRLAEQARAHRGAANLVSRYQEERKEQGQRIF